MLYNLCANGVGGGGGGTGSSFVITDANYLFYSNSRLDNLNDLLGLVKGVKKTKQMFYNCTQLTTVPSIDLSVCEDSDMMFEGCSKMAGIIDLKGAKLKKFQSLFEGCVKLEGILNFFVNTTSYYGASNFVPRGTSSSPAALKRFTFAPGNTYTAFSGLDFSYCSFDREGAVEMFNSLKTVVDRGGTYNQINLTGNPCITGKAIFHSGSYVTVNSRAEAEALFDGVPLDAEVTMKINNDSPKAYPSLEDAFMNFERVEFPTMISWDVITYAVDTLTDEDRAIATGKGWTLVEA